MKSDQSDNHTGREGENYPGPYVRARPHAKGGSISLPPQEQTGRKTVTVEEALHWAYARELVHRAREPGLGAAARFAPRGFAAVASSERIGAAVGSSMNLGFEAPRDAYTVMAAVNACGEPRLVREYAMTGERPDWTPHPALWWEQGPPMMGKDERKRRIVIGYTVFLRGDLDALVAERRNVYRRWAMAVARVHELLSQPGALADRALAGVLPPYEPWSQTNF